MQVPLILMIPEHYDYDLPKPPPWWPGLLAVVVMAIIAIVAACAIEIPS